MANLTLKTPKTGEHKEWVQRHVDGYVAAVTYLSEFVILRANMGDISGEEVWAEIERNTMLCIREALDLDGPPN